jgi:hypothetical protein
MPRRDRYILTAIVLCCAGALVAQFQVNRRVDNSLYGAGSAPSIKYSRNTSIAMPSEVRYAEIRSGALPSELAMNRAAMGPLASGGNIAYVPPQPTWTQVRQQVAAAPPPRQSPYATGSIKHSNLPASPNQIVAQPISTAVSTSMGSSNINKAFSSSATPTGWSTTPNSTGNTPVVPYTLDPNATFTVPQMSGSIRNP